MKKFAIIFLLGLVGFSSVYAQTTVVNTPQQQNDIQVAKQGCQKKLGFFPTPSKIMCVLTAIGKAESEIKPKAVAIIFTVCQGHGVQAQGTAAANKKYDTLGACLNDPSAIAQINQGLTSQGFPAIKVVNPSVLKSI